MAKSFKFKKFPQEVYVTQERDGDESYFLVWEKEEEAVKSAASDENFPKVAVYEFNGQGKAVVTAEIVFE